MTRTQIDILVMKLERMIDRLTPNGTKGFRLYHPMTVHLLQYYRAGFVLLTPKAIKIIRQAEKYLDNCSLSSEFMYPETPKPCTTLFQSEE